MTTNATVRAQKYIGFGFVVGSLLLCVDFLTHVLKGEAMSVTYVFGLFFVLTAVLVLGLTAADTRTPSDKVDPARFRGKES